MKDDKPSGEASGRKAGGRGKSRPRPAPRLLAPLYEDQGIRTGPPRPVLWLQYAAAIRLALLAVVAAGAFVVFEPGQSGMGFLLVYFALGFTTSICYFIAVRRQHGAPRLLTWAQVLVDLAVVAATVTLTGGPTSFFTFLFVVVILEATLLLGIMDGFVYATLAAAVILRMRLNTIAPGTDAPLSMWYSFLVEGLAFYLTAAISGFWHQRLRRLQQFQHDILDHLNNGFLITDPDGVVAALNKAGGAILELEPEAAIGRPVQEVVQVNSGGESPILTAIRSERDFTSYEFTAAVGGGATRLIGLTTSRITDARGTFNGVIASFTDLTEMDDMRRELQRQDRLAVVGELAAGLAHEIRNPVAAIQNAVEELRSGKATEPIRTRLMDIVLRETAQLNQIVGGFLNFARNPVIHRKRFDVARLVEEVVEALRMEMSGRDALTIVFQAPEAPAPVSADRSQLKQVCMNIAKNGIEAMDYAGRLEIAVTRDKSTVFIRFDDEGPGIDPDQTARIFEPFFTTKDTGTGMGLAVCQRIVTAHDGTIRIASREGGGASMVVRLPVGASEEKTV